MSDTRSSLPSQVEAQQLLRFALELADVCRDSIARTLREGLEVEVKADSSLVTSADVNAEAAFRAAVNDRFPAHGVLGEERGHSNPQSPFTWVVDPIDGTAEFARGIPTYGTIIGLRVAGEPLLGVIDHPALSWRVSGGRHLGVQMNGAPITWHQRDPRGVGGTGYRIGLPSRAGFVRRGSDGEVFEQVTRAYPECRSFHTCFSHACALTGALDAAIEWDVPLWDIGALEAMMLELGGFFETVRLRDGPDGQPLHSVVFGRVEPAAQIAALIENMLRQP